MKDSILVAHSFPLEIILPTQFFAMNDWLSSHYIIFTKNVKIVSRNFAKTFSDICLKAFIKIFYVEQKIARS